MVVQPEINEYTEEVEEETNKEDLKKIKKTSKRISIKDRNFGQQPSSIAVRSWTYCRRTFTSEKENTIDHLHSDRQLLAKWKNIWDKDNVRL